MKIKRILIMLTMVFTILSFSSVAWAVPVILFTTNGHAGNYASGAVMLIRGWVGENSIGESGTPTLVLVKNTSDNDRTIYSAQVNTNADGYFTTSFNLGAMDREENNVNISVHGADTSAALDFTVVKNPADFQFAGGSIQLADSKNTLIPVAVPNKIDLVFTSNVNYFNNVSWPSTAGLPSGVSTYLDLNERNADCIKLYNDETGQPVNCRVELSDISNGDTSYGQYYPLDSSITKTVDQTGKTVTGKNVLRVTPLQTLSQGTTYRLEIDKDLSANNSSSLGQTQIVYFKILSSYSSGGTSENQPATPAADLGQVTKAGNTTTLHVDSQKALNILNGEQQNALSIDISSLAGTAGAEVAVQLPTAVVDAAQHTGKPIILHNGDLAIFIPPAALPQGEDITISTAQPNMQTLPAATEQVANAQVYEFNAQLGSQSTHTLQQAVTITLPIPQGVTNPEKLGVYFLNEATGQWEYVGGRIIDGKLVFTTSHFSKYMVAESKKTFADISNHWARETIEIMAGRQIVSGVSATDFAPDRNITRAEFATLLIRALKLDQDNTASGFSDVSQADWYAGYVSEAAKIGLVQGDAGQFRPNDQINRQEMAAMVMQAYRYKGGKPDSGSELIFADKETISPWAVESVKSAYKLGIIKGRGEGQFAPLENATRAEAAVMLKGLMDQLDKLE